MSGELPKSAKIGVGALITAASIAVFMGGAAADVAGAVHPLTDEEIAAVQARIREKSGNTDTLAFSGMAATKTDTDGSILVCGFAGPKDNVSVRKPFYGILLLPQRTFGAIGFDVAPQIALDVCARGGIKL